MKTLIIPIMNGASASFLSRKHRRKYFSDVIINVLHIDHQLCDKFKVKVVRGGAIFSKKRAIRKFIRQNQGKDHYLLACGKSYGAVNIAKILRRWKGELDYEKTHLFLVDPCWVTKFLMPKAGLKVPPVDLVSNIYQDGKGMSGAPVNQKQWREMYDKYGTILEQAKLSSVNHWNIIYHNFVKIGIADSIKSLLGLEDECV